jgi:uncharacterized membrane protein YjfL (UPF0719 family)
MVGMYGGLLRLYPRKFQTEFREEMQVVFDSAVKDAVGVGTFSLLRLLFFELLDFPISLAIEHFSQWRKEWSMKDTRHGIRPFRSAEMGALGLFVGYLIVGLWRWHLILPRGWYNVHIGIPITFLVERIPSALNSALASALLGLMLCLSVSASKRVTVRTCLLMAGLEFVANLIGPFIPRSHLFGSIMSSLNENWVNIAIVLLGAVMSMIEGLFTGAGLGLGAGGWKFSWRFALKGMLAYGLGFAGMVIFQKFWVSSGLLRWTSMDAFAVIIGCVFAILAGGILGWMWGKGNPVGMPKEKTA